MMSRCDVTGIILAGGRSSRFGSNKAFATIGNETLVERVVRQIQDIFPEVIIVTNDPLAYVDLGLTIVTDIIPHQGPLGGIYTGLFFGRFPSVFVTACDMPFINTPLIRYMVSRKESFDVVVPKIDDKFEPLCALYGKRCLKPMQKLLEGGKRQVIEVFKSVKVLTIEKDEVHRFDPGEKCFFNINTVEDWKKALKDF